MKLEQKDLIKGWNVDGKTPKKTTTSTLNSELMLRVQPKKKTCTGHTGDPDKISGR